LSEEHQQNQRKQGEKVVEFSKNVGPIWDGHFRKFVGIAVLNDIVNPGIGRWFHLFIFFSQLSF